MFIMQVDLYNAINPIGDECQGRTGNVSYSDL